MLLIPSAGLTELEGAQASFLLKQDRRNNIGGQDTHFVLNAYSRGGFLLWQGNFYDPQSAWRFWQRLTSNSLTFEDWVVPTPMYDPSLRDLPYVDYQLATVTSFTAVGSTSYTPPTYGNIFYLVVAGGASGGTSGGGGAGGYKTNVGGTAYPVQPISYTVIVGNKGTGVSPTGTTKGENGTDSTFNSTSTGGQSAVTSTGGGGGGSNTGGGAGVNGNAGGSGGGGSLGASGSSAGGAGTVGQGNNGGAGTIGGSIAGGGGGGASGTGGNASGSTPGTAGDGSSNSITGSPVTYSAGGSGGNSSSSASAEPANTGNGGDAAKTGASTGDGGTGIVIVSFTQNAFLFNQPMLGM